MEKVLHPIQTYGETSIAMSSGHGTWYRCHPIFATFVGDYPEQCLVTCTKSGHCPKCTVPPDQLGEYSHFPLRNYGKAIETFNLADEDTHQFHAACHKAGLKPVYHPFWSTLPLVDIFLSITPDILHQLLQGVVKHITAWLSNPVVFGAAKINARCRSLPPSHNTTLFPNGITMLSRVSGKEHKDICRILLGLIVDLPLSDRQAPSRVVQAVRGLLDFIYLAQYPSHTTTSLRHLEECLAHFHQNKGVFVDLGVREHINIPKFHSLIHYVLSIKLFGSTDNYNTEQSERLHIDLAKDAYRATNRKDEFSQMTTWLERREKVQMHMALIKRRQQGHTTVPTLVPMGPLQVDTRTLKMTQHPTVKAVTFEELASRYGAVDFQDALADFIASVNYPGATAARLRTRGANTLLPFRSVPVFHRIKFTSTSHNSENSQIVDSVIIRPEQEDTHGRIVPARFDTVIVHGKDPSVVHGQHGEF